MARPGLCVQFGCGLSCPDGWKNFDSSPRLRLQQLPIVGSLVPAGPHGRFPRGVRYGDIVRGLPLPDAGVSHLYSSHVLEHLSLDECRRALKECRRLLAPGGVFRSVLPDLEHMIDEYTAATSPDRAMSFIRSTLMGCERRDTTFAGRLKHSLGSSHHLWLWDFPSLAAELATAGFTEIRRATYRDSGIVEFDAVESEDRWRGALGVHCRG